jgi:hypothetical protein
MTVFLGGLHAKGTWSLIIEHILKVVYADFTVKLSKMLCVRTHIACVRTQF